MKITRSYKLRVYPNKIKGDTVGYCMNRFVSYVNAWLGKLFFNGNKSLSTVGLGQLANQAQHRARGIITAQTKVAKATGSKVNIPEFKKVCCPGRIEKTKNTDFNYWVKISNLWTKGKMVAVPALSHRALNKKLRSGWKLSDGCEVYQDKQGRMFALVFVSKEIPKAEPKPNTLGCDIGYKNSVSRSDRYIGQNLSRVLARQKQKRAEQQRQGHKTKNKKTVIKQLLDTEARKAVGRSKRLKASLIVESPKAVGRLGKYKFQGWAAAYFANRCHILGQEEEVFVWEVNPAYTSVTCSKCGCLDKRSRKGLKFQCQSCDYFENADINAALNIAGKGTSSLRKIFFLDGQEALA